MSSTELGERTIEGIEARGHRWTLEYAKTESGRTVKLTRIHEVWVAPEMRLILRVIDGDPNGVATVWGLERLSLEPDPALFGPPEDYSWQHRRTEKGTDADLRYLDSWFSE